jgi:hypothetical protein
MKFLALGFGAARRERLYVEIIGSYCEKLAL